MKARLLAVQRALHLVLAASLVLAAAGFPRGNDRRYMAAHAELQGFGAGFDQAALEKSLLSYAQAQGVVTLPQIAAAVTGDGVPAVTAAKDAAPVLPPAGLSLRTLGAVLQRASGPTSVDIGVLDASQLGAAIAWRLSRQAGSDGYVLTGVTLAPAQDTTQAVKLEAEVARARAAAREAESKLAQAKAQLTAADELLEARRKWKATWKAILKADEARKEARAALAARQKERDETTARYESGAKRALGRAAPPLPRGASPSFASAKVTLARGGKTVSLDIPVALQARKAALPALQSTSFPATREAGLWGEVQELTPEQAVAAVERHFTWHYQAAPVLQVLPLALPLLLYVLLLRIRRVSVSYNPFGASDDHGGLPRVGLGARGIDLFVLAIAPFLAAVLDVVSLTAVAVVPVVPVLAGIAALSLGAYVYSELGALQSLTEAVTRSHSNPPGPGRG